MSEKVYPMYDDYYKAEAQLQELLDDREILAQEVKNAHPSRVAEGKRMLAETDEGIEQYKAALKAEYDSYQEICRSEEEHEKAKAEYRESVIKTLLNIKRNHPKLYKQSTEKVFADMTPEEIEYFKTRVAELEAERLEEFIGGEAD